MLRFSVFAALAASATARNSLARQPPMGWMSWEIFRCNLASPTDNCTDPSTTNCISQALYEGQADAMVTGGFAAAGYASIHMDDVRTWACRAYPGTMRGRWHDTPMTPPPPHPITHP